MAVPRNGECQYAAEEVCRIICRENIRPRLHRHEELLRINGPRRTNTLRGINISAFYA